MIVIQLSSFSAIYRGENKLSQRDDDEVRFVLDQHS
jgi:hypothetical protein